MKNPTISVIVPVYNTEKYLHRCIDSILTQTYTDFELLLIDDGSKDNSGKICDEYTEKDKRVRVFHKPNGGVSSARNLGLDNAQGEWIIFIDSDDYFLPNAIEILLRNAIKHKTSLSIGNLYMERGGNKTKTRTAYKEGIIQDNFKAWYFNICIPNQGSTLYSSKILTKNMFNSSLSRYEDAETLLTLIKEYKIAYTNECVMVYSRENPGLSRAAKDPYKDYIFNMSFANKSFWHKMILGGFINEGLHIYPHKRDELLMKYRKYLIYAKLDARLAFIRQYIIKHYNKKYYLCLS